MSTFNTDFIFTPGKLTIALDGGAGSSGKGKLGSFLCEYADNWQFACNTFMPQAGHWVKLGDGRKYLYKTLNSCAYLTDKYEKLYIAPGATIELNTFFRELWENNVPPDKIGISPLTSILRDIDKGYERGTCDLNGTVIDQVETGGPLAATGSTRSGCGANRARRALRDKKALYAYQVQELKDFLCDVPKEIMERLDQGQAGLLEIAQGFQLSYLLPAFFPHTTSRNCTVAAGLDDLMVAPHYAGNAVLNFRTFPIRINSNIYLDKVTGKSLVWSDVLTRLDAETDTQDKEKLKSAGIDLIEGDSGPGYSDQHELTWEEVTVQSGSTDPILELTTVTQLPRRVFTFSRQNFEDAVRHNRTSGKIFISVNFANYVDSKLIGRQESVHELTQSVLGKKMYDWIQKNLQDHETTFIGTGEKTDDMILVNPSKDEIV